MKSCKIAKDSDLRANADILQSCFLTCAVYQYFPSKIGSEQVEPLLSDYLAQATQIIFKHGSTVDQFMDGHGVMAMFATANSHGNDAAEGIQAGLELIEMVGSLAPK